ncbi:MAG: hypothetical protein ACYDCC_03130 [Actinomycetota bacterium]
MKITPGRKPRSSRARFRFLTIGFGIALIVSLLALPAGADGSIARVGYLDRHDYQLGIGASGDIIVDEQTGRAYQAIATPSDPPTILMEYALPSTHPIRQIGMPSLAAASTAQGAMQWLWTIDSMHQRLFLIVNELDSTTRSPRYLLETVDLKSMTASTPVSMWPNGDRRPASISYDPGSDRLYVMSSLTVGTPDSRSVFFVNEFQTSGAQDWEHPLPECYGNTDDQFAPVTVRSELQRSFIYLNCYNANLIQSVVVRVHLDSNGQPNPTADEVFPGLPGALSAQFDRGSDRMFFLTTNSGAGRGAWVFDGLRSSFLGIIATGDDRPGANSYGMGVDESTGRLYMQTPVGLLVADARRTPLPGGLLFSQFAGDGIGSIVADPVHHLVFVRDPSSRVGSQSERYVVYKDSIPLTVDPPAGTPDSLTTNVEEQAGKTAVNYSAGGSAFAFRALTTGGVQRAAWNIAIGIVDPQSSSLWTQVQNLPIDQGDRDLYAARVRSVALSNDAASASAIASDADPATLRDLSNNNETWPVDGASCVDDSGTPSKQSGTQNTSSATCDKAHTTVLANAGAQSLSNSTISVGAMFANVSAVRDSNLGTVVTSMATVHDISIGSQAFIGSLTTIASTYAHGRPGTARSSFDRIFSDVRVGSYRCGQCDPSVVQPLLQKALGGQASVSFPAPDPTYVNGSHGGYQAVVERDIYQSYADRALNDDNSIEVPGMEIVYYSDARAGRTREVVQLAGVEADSHYGIYLLPSSQNHILDTIIAPRTIELPPTTTIVTKPSFSVVGKRRTTHHPTSILQRIIEEVAGGLGVHLESPLQALMSAALWIMLLLPFHLLWRRRLIGTRS